MEPRAGWPKGTAAAISRSLDTYYRDTARAERMHRLNAQFVCEGGLAFDIGAHLGDRTASFLQLGARVIAVEPQPAIHRALRLLLAGQERAHLLRCAVGSERGFAELHVNSANPTVSTLSRALVDAAPSDTNWQGQVWDQKLTVPVTTLDRLITAHGVPDFVKIDVEGQELEVLRGLSIPLRALSFEFTALQRQVALDAIKRLTELGNYRFNFSIGEDHKLIFDTWLSGAAIAEDIERMAANVNSGDVYARSMVQPG